MLDVDDLRKRKQEVDADVEGRQEAGDVDKRVKIVVEL